MPLVIPSVALDMPYISLKALIGALVLTPFALPLFRIFKHIIQTAFSATSVVPGPTGGNLVFGHLGLIHGAPKGEWHEKMLKEYGHVLKYKTILGTDTLMTTDPKALNHIVTNTNIYQRPGLIRHIINDINGEGLLSVEGAVHKKQRRIMSPAFSPAHIKEMTEVFLTKSQELRDILLVQTQATPGVGTRVDMPAYLTQVTLDIIGLAGFGYSFNALLNEQSDLSEAVSAVIHPTNGLPIAQILKYYVPIFRYILFFEKNTKDTKRARNKMDDIGRDLVQRKKREITEEKAAGDGSSSKPKDLLSLLIRSNMDERGVGLSDEEILPQIPTFLLAGHETTSSSTSWAMMALATHPDVQTRLRSELLAVETESPTMSELDSLVYLDAFVRESLRYHGALDGIDKVATQDDVIPLEKPFVGRDGRLRDTLEISKGDSVFIPILMMNLSESNWGPDAREFNPDRWLNGGPPKATQSTPTVWGNQMTFMAGPRSCLGFKFALVEMKAILFTLVRAFEFELAIPKEEILRISGGAIARPVARSEKNTGVQMPMIIRPVSQTA